MTAAYQSKNGKKFFKFLFWCSSFIQLTPTNGKTGERQDHTSWPSPASDHIPFCWAPPASPDSPRSSCLAAVRGTPSVPFWSVFPEEQIFPLLPSDRTPFLQRKTAQREDDDGRLHCLILIKKRKEREFNTREPSGWFLPWSVIIIRPPHAVVVKELQTICESFVNTACISAAIVHPQAIPLPSHSSGCPPTSARYLRNSLDEWPEQLPPLGSLPFSQVSTSGKIRFRCTSATNSPMPSATGNAAQHQTSGFGTAMPRAALRGAAAPGRAP